MTVCLKPQTAKARAAKEKKVLSDLAKFVSEQGGMIAAEGMSEFTARHPEHKATPSDLRALCANHAGQLVVLNDGPEFRLVLKTVEKRFLKSLMTFIQKQDDMRCRSDDLPQFLESYPESAKLVNSGRETICQICQRHEDDFLFEKGPADGYCVRLRARCQEAAMNEDEIVADLVRFVRDQNGSVASNAFASFYSRNSHYRSSIANMRAFCERHSQHFQIVDDGKSMHWQLKLASSSSRGAQAAASLAVFIETKRFGKAMDVDELSRFYAEQPLHRNRIFEAGGAEKFCSLYGHFLVFKPGPSGDQIARACHCCYFARGACTHDGTHDKYLHTLPTNADTLQVACPKL